MEGIHAFLCSIIADTKSSFVIHGACVCVWLGINSSNLEIFEDSV